MTVIGLGDYIDRQAVMQEFANRVRRSNNSDFAPTPTWNQAVQIVEDFPAADVAPVRRGKWLRTTCSPHRIFCSECYGTFIPDDEVTRLKDVPHRFCPKCGASMGEF